MPHKQVLFHSPVRENILRGANQRAVAECAAPVLAQNRY